MAAVQLLPGGGMRYTSETFTTAANVGADTIDCQMCSEIAVQQIAVGSPGGTFQMQERLSSAANWTNLGTAITVGDAINAKFSQSSRPFTQIRINPAGVTGLSSTVTLTLLIQGGRVAGGAVI